MCGADLVLDKKKAIGIKVNMVAAPFGPCTAMPSTTMNIQLELFGHGKIFKEKLHGGQQPLNNKKNLQKLMLPRKEKSDPLWSRAT
jgi:hypothetical protein